MREDALNGEPIAKERYEKTLAMRREAYHSKKSEQTAWQYAYDHDTLVAELMRISWSDANIVLAKEIWYCIDSLTNRNFVKETFLMTMNKGVSVRINRINLNREKSEKW